MTDKQLAEALEHTARHRAASDGIDPDQWRAVLYAWEKRALAEYESARAQPASVPDFWVAIDEDGDIAMDFRVNGFSPESARSDCNQWINDHGGNFRLRALYPTAQPARVAEPIGWAKDVTDEETIVSWSKQPPEFGMGGWWPIYGEPTVHNPIGFISQSNIKYLAASKHKPGVVHAADVFDRSSGPDNVPVYTASRLPSQPETAQEGEG